MRVAIQGELGSFSHEAARTLAPEEDVVPCATAEDVLRLLDRAAVKAAVIPVENSLAGSVVDFYDLFFAHEFTIEREYQMRIRHNLIAAPGTVFEDVRQAISHPVALAQCREFFAAHPQVKATSFYDTAGAVQRVMRERKPDTAAIASRQAAVQYGAEILRENIEDRAGSQTRFWLIRKSGRSTEGEPAPTKLSLMFSLENRPGALLQALGVFAARRLNLTKIESRPMAGRPWEYVFYADVSIQEREDAEGVLGDLRGICPLVKELGRYTSLQVASN